MKHLKDMPGEDYVKKNGFVLNESNTEFNKFSAKV